MGDENVDVGGEISQNSQIVSGRLGGDGRRGQSRTYIGGGLGIGLPKVEKSPIISVVNFVRKELALELVRSWLSVLSPQSVM